MKLNLEMANKLNLKSTKEPEDQKIVESSRRKVAFEKKIEQVCYCWAHIFGVKKSHSSRTFSSPAPGHQRVENQKYHRGQQGWEMIQWD